VSALMGSLACASRAWWRTSPREEGLRRGDEEMKKVAAKAQELKDALLRAVDDDSNAFDE